MNVTIFNPFTNENMAVSAMTKDEYLEARRGWRKEYSELSVKIRNKKFELKECHRAGEFGKIAGLTIALKVLADYATSAIEQRQIMKLTAKASYDAEYIEQQVAA